MCQSSLSKLSPPRLHYHGSITAHPTSRPPMLDCRRSHNPRPRPLVRGTNSASLPRTSRLHHRPTKTRLLLPSPKPTHRCSRIRPRRLRAGRMAVLIRDPGVRVCPIRQEASKRLAAQLHGLGGRLACRHKPVGISLSGEPFGDRNDALWNQVLFERISKVPVVVEDFTRTLITSSDLHTDSERPILGGSLMSFSTSDLEYLCSLCSSQPKNELTSVSCRVLA